MPTLKDIFLSSTKLSPSRSNSPNPSPNIRIDKIVPFAGANMCLYQLSMNGVTQAFIRHRVNILVTDINVLREDPKNPNYMSFTDKDGVFFIPKVDTKKDTFKIRCSCHDFYFTWGIWNFTKGAIFGNKPRPYKRLTPPPPKGYPYRNPKHLMGLCKHVRNSVNTMIKVGWFK